MDAKLTSVAQNCLNATHDGSLSFGAIVSALIEAGFEAYAVDYRRGAQTFYLPNGESLDLPLPQASRPVAAAFDAVAVEAQVRWAQSGDTAYTYRAFTANVTAAGCAGYLVSFLGRRVVYFGRTGETRVEHLPT